MKFAGRLMPSMILKGFWNIWRITGIRKPMNHVERTFQSELSCYLVFQPCILHPIKISCSGNQFSVSKRLSFNQLMDNSLISLDS